MFRRLYAVAALALLVAVPAHGSAAPTLPPLSGLRAFLLRADEPIADTFARTPSFAWTPYSGATRYDFELATSKSFDDSTVVWSTTGRKPPLRSPVVSIPLSLPWMTGKPYALYTHVRAVTRYGVTPWSAPLGFNMRWKTIPEQVQPDLPGLVRWTPVEGATSYDVWFLDAAKVISTVTNVADEREYYTFHRDPKWTGVVHWRVRAVRTVYGQASSRLPVVAYGPWSSAFSSTNTPVTDGALALDSAVSDTVSTPDAPKPHALTPGFSFSGNETFDGTTGDLYRVYIATDSQCVNVVYKGPIVGSPAYAPRITGPLKLPTTPKDETAAESAYLVDGPQKEAFTADYLPITSSEEVPTSSSSSASSSSSSSSTGTSSTAGAPVDLWDSGWPTGRYYWTVVPVQDVLVDTDSIQYYDLEVPQDACVEGRVSSFGKGGQPTTEAAGKPYASGLSPTGQLVAAQSSKPLFYGAPLVSWQPALGATSYEVEWSKQLYPWKPVGKPAATEATSALLEGLTPGTWYYRVRGLDAYLPGTAKQMAWSAPVAIIIAKPQFRVDDVEVTVAAAPLTTKRAGTSSSWNGDFTVVLPSGWHRLAKNDPSLAQIVQKFGSIPAKFEFFAVENTHAADFSVLKGPARGSLPLPDWEASAIAEAKRLGGSGISVGATRLAGRQTVRVSFTLRRNGHALWVLQYVIDQQHAGFALTFATPEPLKTRFAPIFGRIARSFTFSA